jgi:transposase
LREDRLITIGVDAHKRVHVAVGLDDAGSELARWRGANSPDGWRSLLAWGAALGEARRWGVEGAWGYGRGLSQHLVAAGETVFDINARWTAAGRRRAKRPGKSDPLDARAVALVVRQEAPSLPAVLAEDETAVLDLLTTEREGALGEATRLRNQIHALLAQLDPEYHLRLPALKSQTGLRALRRYTAESKDTVQQERAAAVRRLAERLDLSLSQAADIGRRIRELAQERFEPLTQLCGVNLLTAGAIAGILGPGHRFTTDSQLAAYAGVAPLEASSAGLVRHRLNRGGNRRLNAIIYRIALTQAHHLDEARSYLERRQSEGKTKREAIRALKRFIIRAIWRLWLACKAQEIPVPIKFAA